MHHTLALVLAVGLVGNYVVDAQDAPKTTGPPDLDKAVSLSGPITLSPINCNN